MKTDSEIQAWAMEHRQSVMDARLLHQEAEKHALASAEPITPEQVLRWMEKSLLQGVSVAQVIATSAWMSAS